MRQLSIVNRTEDIIGCNGEHIFKNENSKIDYVYPSCSLTVQLPSFRVALTLFRDSSNEKADYGDETQSVTPDGFTIRAPLALGAMWKVVKVSEGCPWAIYRIKVRQEHNV
jgi:1-phosphatidylinositol phosphodiesterase